MAAGGIRHYEFLLYGAPPPATILNACGFEAQTVANAGEVYVSSGSPTISTVTFRTGRCALRIDPDEFLAEWVWIGKRNVYGLIEPIARSAETFFTFYIRDAASVTATSQIAQIVNSAGTNVVQVLMTTSGALTLAGLTTSSTFGTRTMNTWHRIDIRCTQNGTSYASMDGGTEQSCIANNNQIDFLQLGRSTTPSTALDFYYDDVVISSAGFPGEVSLRPSYPNGAGVNTGWTNGTGSGAAQVDDWETGVHDSDTTYIGASNTMDGQQSDFGTQNCAAIGVASDSTVLGLVGLAALRSESTTGTSTIGLYFDSSSTFALTTGVEAGTSYEFRGLIAQTDPATGVAWTQPGVNAASFGVYAGVTLDQAQRCTALLVYVVEVLAAVTTVTPAPTALKLTTITPTLRQTAKPVAGALKLTGVAPAVKQTAKPVAAALKLTSLAPTVRLVATPAATALKLTTIAPAGRQTTKPAPTALKLTTVAPALRQTAKPAPLALKLTTTTFALNACIITAKPAAQVALFTIPAPLATVVGGPITVSPDPVAIKVTVPAPVARLVVSGVTTNLRVTTVAPTAARRVAVSPVPIKLTVPAPIVSLRASLTAAALRLTTIAPTTKLNIRVTPAPTALKLTSLAPTLRLTTSPSAVALRLSTVLETVKRAVQAGVTALKVTIPAPSVKRYEAVNPTSLKLTTVAPTVRLITRPAPTALRLTTVAPDAAVSTVPPLYLDASYTPTIQCNASYTPTVSANASYTPTLSLNASYVPSGNYNASNEPSITLAGSYG